MEQLHRDIIAVQRKFRDWIDDRNHPAIRQLDRDIQRIEDDIQTRKNPRSVEDQIKRVIHALDAAEGSGGMSDGHLNELQDYFEAMRSNLRKLM